MRRYNNIPIIVIAFYALLVYGACNLIMTYTLSANYIKMIVDIVFLWVFYKAAKNYSSFHNPNMYKIFTFFTIFILLRGSLFMRFPLENGHELASPYGIIRSILIDPYGALSFIIILFYLIPFDPQELKYYRKLGYICTFICVVFIFSYRAILFSSGTFGATGVYFNGVELTIRNLISWGFIGFGAVLLLGFNFNAFHKSWLDYMPMVVIFLYFLASVAGGGRGGSVTALFYVVAMLYFYLTGQNKYNAKKAFNQLFRLCVAIGVVVSIWYLFARTDFFDYLFTRAFEGGEFGGELNESTRETFVANLQDELNKHPISWLLGRGINGYYMSAVGARGTIEWGYWHLILKGGIIYLLLYVIVLLRTAYMGFFKSNNQMAKTMGVLCLLRAYALIPYGLPDVTLEALLVWHYVRLINTDSFRKMTDLEIKNYINS